MQSYDAVPGTSLAHIPNSGYASSLSDQTQPKPLYWASGAKDELLALPPTLVHNFGYALSAIQFGKRPASSVKPVLGFAAALFELRDNDAAGTYRVIYCTAFDGVAYVLHCFQKKSPSGSSMPRATLALIRRRLNEVRTHYEEVVRSA